MNTALGEQKKDLTDGAGGLVLEQILDDISISQIKPIVDPMEQVEMLFGDGSDLVGGKFVTFAKIAKNGFRHRFVPREDITEDLLRTYSGREDVYLGMQPSYTRSRRSEHISQLRCLYVDLDHYNIGRDFYDVWTDLHENYFGKSIPVPNAINSTGRGTLLIYLIEPEKSFRRDIWSPVMDYLIKTCMPLGADTSCNDISRVFRLVGSKNSKSGNTVQMFKLHDQRYDLRDLKKTLVPRVRKPRVIRGRQSAPDLRAVPEGLREHCKSMQSYNIRRVEDFRKISEIRKGELDGSRHYLLFLTRLHTLLGTNGDDNRALEYMGQLNDSFVHPKDMRQVERETRTAIDSYNRFVKVGPAGLYTYSPERLVKDFALSLEDQQQMKVIFGPEEGTRRHSARKSKWRRANGVKPIKIHQEQLAAEKEANIETLRAAIEENPDLSNVKLGAVLGWSEYKVRTLKKLL